MALPLHANGSLFNDFPNACEGFWRTVTHSCDGHRLQLPLCPVVLRLGKSMDANDASFTMLS